MIEAHMNETTWRELCEAIMKEQDPKKLLNLVDDLNRELERREKESKYRMYGAMNMPE
jgi:hypothetical protein